MHANHESHGRETGSIDVTSGIRVMRVVSCHHPPSQLSLDTWLAAFARVHNAIVVTNEQSSPKSRRAVKLPDVCNEFNVEWVDTFMMLLSLGVEFGMNRDDS